MADSMQPLTDEELDAMDYVISRAFETELHSMAAIRAQEALGDLQAAYKRLRMQQNPWHFIHANLKVVTQGIGSSPDALFSRAEAARVAQWLDGCREEFRKRVGRSEP